MIIKRLASQLDRRDEEPNIELAKELVNENNLEGIQEIIDHLVTSKDKRIKQDIIKVAYEIGKMKPELISDYAIFFINLLKSRNNRLVWGAMQALSTIATIAPDVIVKHLDTIFSAMKIGSVITVDKGVLTLAKVASVKKEQHERIFSYLLQHLETCRTKEIPQHAESMMIAVNKDNKDRFLTVLKNREHLLTIPQLKRVKKIYKALS